MGAWPPGVAGGEREGRTWRRVYPYLHIGGAGISTFTVLVVVAIAVPVVLVCPPLLRRHGVPLDFLTPALIAAFLGGAVGARLWNDLEHWPPTGPWWAGGFTWYGAVVGGFVALLAVCLWRRVPPGLWFNLLVPAVALGQAIGRVGCLLAGDGDYGRPSGLPWAMGFPHGVVPTPPGVTVHPTPIYESLALLVIFVVLYRMARPPRPAWLVGAWYLILTGAARFLVEFVRRNPSWFAGLTEAQWASLVAIAIGVVGAAALYRRPPATMPAAGGVAQRAGAVPPGP